MAPLTKIVQIHIETHPDFKQTSLYLPTLDGDEILDEVSRVLRKEDPRCEELLEPVKPVSVPAKHFGAEEAMLVSYPAEIIKDGDETLDFILRLNAYMRGIDIDYGVARTQPIQPPCITSDGEEVYVNVISPIDNKKTKCMSVVCFINDPHDTNGPVIRLTMPTRYKE